MTEALDYDTIFEPAPIFLKKFCNRVFGWRCRHCEAAPCYPLCRPPLSPPSVTPLCHPPLSPPSVTPLCHPPLSPPSVTPLCHPPLSPYRQSRLAN